jgi:hypothetical protein
MPPSNVVVDGSNIATEGRTTPSLEQLDQAVRQYLEEHPGANVTVVVDASFGHRIAPSERAAFEQAVAHGELVSPPAGAIGRGDAFLLRIAGRIGARVLSNDSFREFHAEHPWLFDEDRLVGGTPVPSVGWIFTPRRPVRGPLTPAAAGPGRRGSKNAADHGSDGEDDESDAVRAGTGASAVAKSSSAEGTKPKGGRSRGSRRGKASDRKVQDAIAEATEEALTSGKQKQQKGKPKPKSEAAPEAVNDPLPFITFASEHPVGSEVQGTVVSFTSHGAMAQVEDMLCYVPLAGLGDPPPRRARDVLHQGETRTFELVALDPARRGAQLALPEVVAVHGEIAEGAEEAASEVRRRRKRRGATSSAAEPEHATPGKSEPTGVARAGTKQAAAREKLAGGTKASLKRPARTERGTQATRLRGAKSAEPAKKVDPAKKTQGAKKAQAAKKAAPAKKAAAKKSPTKKAVATKDPARRKVSAATKTAPAAKVRPAKKAVSSKATHKTTDPPNAAQVRKSPGSGQASAPRTAPASRKAGSGVSKAAPTPQKTSASLSKAASKTASTKTAAKKAGPAKASAANKQAKTTKGPGKPAKK